MTEKKNSNASRKTTTTKSNRTDRNIFAVRGEKTPYARQLLSANIFPLLTTGAA